MPILDFQNLMPLLVHFAADGAEHWLSDVIEAQGQRPLAQACVVYPELVFAEGALAELAGLPVAAYAIAT